MVNVESNLKSNNDQHITNGIGRIGYMQGGSTAQWTDEELGMTFNSKAIEFIDNSRK